MKLKNIKNSAIVLNSFWICKGTDKEKKYNSYFNKNESYFTVEKIYDTCKELSATENFKLSVKLKELCNKYENNIKTILKDNINNIKKADMQYYSKLPNFFNGDSLIGQVSTLTGATLNDNIKIYLFDLIVKNLLFNKLEQLIEEKKFTEDALELIKDEFYFNNLSNNCKAENIKDGKSINSLINEIKKKINDPKDLKHVAEPVITPVENKNKEDENKKIEEKTSKETEEDKKKKEDEERIKKEEEEKNKKDEEIKKKNAELKEELNELETKIGSLTSTEIQNKLDTILNKDEFKNIINDENNKILINKIIIEISSKIEKEEIEKKNKEIEKIKNDKEKLKNTLREDLNKIKNESKDKIFQDIQTALNIVLNIGSYKDLFNDIEFKKMIDKIENIIKEKLTEDELSVILQSESCKNFLEDDKITSLIEEINKIIEEKKDKEERKEKEEEEKKNDNNNIESNKKKKCSNYKKKR